MVANTEQQSVAIVVNINEWNEQRAMIKEIAETVKSFAETQNEYLTPKEVCAVLKIGRNTFERWKNAGKIPVCNIQGAKCKRVRRADIEKLLQGGKC